MDVLIYALNFALLSSCLLDPWCRSAEQRFSIGIVRALLAILLLGLVQLYFSTTVPASLVAPLFFSENVLAFILLLLMLNLQPVMVPAAEGARLYRAGPWAVAGGGLIIGGIWIFHPPVFQITATTLTFPHFGQLFVSSLFVLASVLIMAWRLEILWRSLDRQTRLPYKYLVLGFFLIIGSLGWSTSFRLTYLRLNSDHLMLLAILLLLAWLLSLYAVADSRLLNRRIFISRKIVYSTIAPSVFAVYLIGVGLISILMETFGWSLHFVLQWLLIVSGLLLIAVLTLSSRVRDHIRYFISTHFYVNKYEYRDEWLNFSELLHHQLTEEGVVGALRDILKDSLYTDAIKIWVGDEKTGFHLTETSNPDFSSPDTVISPDDPLIACLKNVSYLDCMETASDVQKKERSWKNTDFYKSLGLVLLVPLAIGGHFVGIIGLGKEYTGGKYGKDDFDLLSAISSQAASALLAVRMAEDLAKAREQSAWHTLSAFVLHDIKNAATMLSLVQKNAPQHIQNPEFQQDMLASVDDALKRMNKVQARLNTLKGDIEPTIQSVDAGQLLQGICTRLDRKLTRVQIETTCPQGRVIHTDPDFLGLILENLVLNAMEAGSETNDIIRMQLRLEVNGNKGFQMECRDNGPGIPLKLLPDHLFEPFISLKPKGSGIGLWQVKRLVESLGGEITANNVETGGAWFLLSFE